MGKTNSSDNHIRDVLIIRNQINNETNPHSKGGGFIFIDMFQYISEIIKNISPRQRFFALVVVLLTILLITLGGEIISAFTNSDRVLENKITRLEDANILLNNQNRELQTILIQSQIQCTKDITQVREEILREIGQLEREMNRTSGQLLFERRTEPVTGSNSNDTVVMMSQQPRVIQINPNKEVMSHLKSMKKKLEEDLENANR